MRKDLENIETETSEIRKIKKENLERKKLENLETIIMHYALLTFCNQSIKYRSVL